MKYKKLTVPGAICAAILLCTAVTVFAKGSTQNNTEKVNIQKNTSKTEPVKKESLPAKSSTSSPALIAEQNGHGHQIILNPLQIQKILKNMKNLACHIMQIPAILCIMEK